MYTHMHTYIIIRKSDAGACCVVLLGERGGGNTLHERVCVCMARSKKIQLWWREINVCYTNKTFMMRCIYLTKLCFLFLFYKTLNLGRSACQQKSKCKVMSKNRNIRSSTPKIYARLKHTMLLIQNIEH